MNQFTSEKAYIVLEHMALMLERNAAGALRLEQEKERRMYAAALRETMGLLEDAGVKVEKRAAPEMIRPH